MIENRHFRYCKICNKKMKIIRKLSPSNLNSFCRLISPDGVVYRRVWFCNCCWKDVVSNTDFDYKKHLGWRDRL